MKESKKLGENLNDEHGGNLIHTSQARAILMQKLMAGRDMGNSDM